MLQGFSQATLNGRIQDAETRNPLVGVRILVEGTDRGTLSRENGAFSIKVASLPATLICTYFGYTETRQVVEEEGKNIVIEMNAEAFEVEVVEIRGQSVDQKKKGSALTIESLSPLAIKQTASENFYDGLGALKGVDLTSASLGIKVVNTRGFNSTTPVRILQTIDGVDNASPSVNFALGNFLGSSELDLQGVDLIVGASSAFYGPNAFNGVIKMDSKDPFLSQGLSAFIKMGERNIVESG
ncbi:MAG: carboxypeptidase-like regulatory domain-containing protein, partial [Bacteroidetes bacterium]|nr:carboxypeptidase-like regulatory domain-containing protein [Bacteroidota bacterium]